VNSSRARCSLARGAIRLRGTKFYKFLRRSHLRVRIRQYTLFSTRTFALGSRLGPEWGELNTNETGPRGADRH
jgi:hypothetical protein